MVAMMMHETNTFSPVPTPLGAFRPLAGEAALEEFRDTNTQLGGFLQVARERGLAAEEASSLEAAVAATADIGGEDL